jgi:hypothetical protein
VAASSWFSIPAISKPKRRGRKDARVPLDEGNGEGYHRAREGIPWWCAAR